MIERRLLVFVWAILLNKTYTFILGRWFIELSGYHYDAILGRGRHSDELIVTGTNFGKWKILKPL